jgi:hypothetical protein
LNIRNEVIRGSTLRRSTPNSLTRNGDSREYQTCDSSRLRKKISFGQGQFLMCIFPSGRPKNQRRDAKAQSSLPLALLDFKDISTMEAYLRIGQRKCVAAKRKGQEIPTRNRLETVLPLSRVLSVSPLPAMLGD